MIVWDENDYSGIGIGSRTAWPFPPVNQNQVVLTVQTNGGSEEGVKSDRFYDSFSLLKSLEAGFGLPCLNWRVRQRGQA